MNTIFPDKLKLISLLVASLTLGILLLVNLDRATNAIEGLDSSQHGWPLVYLERSPTKMVLEENAPSPFAWPWPPVPDEERVFSWTNLLTDLIVGVALVVVVYFLLLTVLNRVFGTQSGNILASLKE